MSSTHACHKSLQVGFLSSNFNFVDSFISFLKTFWCTCGPFQFDFVFSACLHMLTILKYMYAKVVTLNPMSNFTSSWVAFIVWHTCQYLQANCLIMQIEMQMLLILFMFLVYEKWILLLLI